MKTHDCFCYRQKTNLPTQSHMHYIVYYDILLGSIFCMIRLILSQLYVESHCIKTTPSTSASFDDEENHSLQFNKVKHVVLCQLVF